MFLGSVVSFENNSERRVNIQVYTVGRSFVVIHSNLLPGEKSKHDLHKVWYDIVYDFDSGERYEDCGRYFGDDHHFKVQDDVLENNSLKKSGQADSTDQTESSKSDSRDSEETSETNSNGHAATKDEGETLADHCVSSDFNTTPKALFEAIYRKNDFMSDFHRNVANLKDIEVGEWQKAEGDEGSEKRELKYIMPLDGSMGPKETHCESTEIIQHNDEEKFIAVLGESRTPDVPYGSSFYTQTRTCFTWNKKGGTHLSVSCETKFSKSTMMKGIIKRSSHEGQTKSNKNMVNHLRKWIKDHPDDFPKVNDAPADESSMEEEASESSNDKEGKNENQQNSEPYIGFGPFHFSNSFRTITPLTVLLLACNLYVIGWAFTERCPCP